LSIYKHCYPLKTRSYRHFLQADGAKRNSQVFIQMCHAILESKLYVGKNNSLADPGIYKDAIG